MRHNKFSRVSSCLSSFKLLHLMVNPLRILNREIKYEHKMNFTDFFNSGASVNDLNEPPVYDLSLSQYHSSGSTYDETYSAEVQVDEATRVAPSSNKSKRQSQRSTNFTMEEDKLLVSAWLNVGIDPVKGSDQKKSQFWSRISQYFEDNKKWEGERTEKSLTNRWSVISNSVSKFCGHYSDVEHLRRSGCTEQDKVVQQSKKRRFRGRSTF